MQRHHESRHAARHASLATAGTGPGPGAGWWRCAPLLLLLWVVANWGWTCWFGLTNDDFQWIGGADLGGRSDWLRQAVLPKFWSMMFFRPLVQLSFVVNYLVAGLHPWAYHLFNVALHTANVFLVWRLALTILGSVPLALVTSMVFAVHPTLTEGVAWVSGRTELLCAFFYLAAILSHLKGRLPWAYALFALALCSKESAISLPLVVCIADWLGIGEHRRMWRRAAAYAGVVALYLLLRTVAVREFAIDMIGISSGNPLQLSNVVHLAREKVTLLGQYLLEPFAVHGFIRSALALGGILVVSLLSARRTDPVTRRAIHFALAWIGLTLAPYLGWPRLGTWYLYLAIIGSSLLFSVLGSAAARRIAAGRYHSTVAAVGVAFWLGASVFRLQTNNEYERRAGLLSLQIIDAVVSAVPAPRPHTVFLVTGIERLRHGFEPAVNYRGVLVYGLPDAIQVWFHDRSLIVTFEPSTVWFFAGEHPIIHVHWDPTTETARVVPDAGAGG